MWQLIINECKYVHFKFILIMIPVFLGINYLTSFFMSFESDNLLGIIGGTNVLTAIMNDKNQKKGIFYCKLPVSAGSAAFMRLFNTLISAQIFMLFIVITAYIYPDVITAGENVLVIIVYMIGGVIWLIIDDLTKLKKHQFIKSRVILLMAMIVGAGLIIINPLKLNYEQGMLVFLIMLLLLSYISIKTYKRRMSYLP